MATERQIAANRRNAERSCGPTSPEGKARSRTNATKHGMAGESAEVEACFSPEFEKRRARWAAEQQPVGEAANFALDRVVAATFRLERCERSIDNTITSFRQRARLAWDEDRAIEAAHIYGRLERDPVLASRQLRATVAGVMLLIDAWFALLAPLEPGKDWSESECSKALDLLGIAADHRSGRTRIDPPEGSDSVVFRQKLAQNELERLEKLRDKALAPLDEMERRQAMAGDVALLSKPARLLLRYERDAWKRFHDSMNELKSPPLVAPSVMTAPSPVVVEPPKIRERPAAPAAPKKSFEQERRELLADAEPYYLEAIDRLKTAGFDNEDAWLEELERRIESYPTPPGSFVPIAAAVGPVA
jgi:hypothetical protein